MDPVVTSSREAVKRSEDNGPDSLATVVPVPTEVGSIVATSEEPVSDTRVDGRVGSVSVLLCCPDDTASDSDIELPWYVLVPVDKSSELKDMVSVVLVLSVPPLRSVDTGSVCSGG